MSAPEKWVSVVESKLAELEENLEKLRNEMKEELRKTTSDVKQDIEGFLITLLATTTEWIRTEASLRDRILFLRHDMPRDTALTHIKAAFGDVKRLALSIETARRELKKYIGRDLPLENIFLQSTKWPMEMLMTYSKPILSFDEFLSCMVDEIGTKDVKRILTPDDVLRVYGVEARAKYQTFLSK